jgi:hypothetical protein
MLNRRKVLGLATAGVGSTLVGLPGFAISSSILDFSPSFNHVVYDKRFQASVEFGSAFPRANLYDASKGVEKLWYQSLKRQLLQSRQAVVGLTDKLSVFCLEELARDVGMNMLLRADHSFIRDKKVQHTAFGPTSFISAINEVSGELDLGKVMARILAEQYELLPSQTRRIEESAQKQGGAFSSGNETVLVSWLMI